MATRIVAILLFLGFIVAIVSPLPASRNGHNGPDLTQMSPLAAFKWEIFYRKQDVGKAHKGPRLAPSLTLDPDVMKAFEELGSDLTKVLLQYHCSDHASKQALAGFTTKLGLPSSSTEKRLPQSGQGDSQNLLFDFWERTMPTGRDADDASIVMDGRAIEELAGHIPVSSTAGSEIVPGFARSGGSAGVQRPAMRRPTEIYRGAWFYTRWLNLYSQMTVQYSVNPAASSIVRHVAAERGKPDSESFRPQADDNGFNFEAAAITAEWMSYQPQLDDQSVAVDSASRSTTPLRWVFDHYIQLNDTLRVLEDMSTDKESRNRPLKPAKG